MLSKILFIITRLPILVSCIYMVGCASSAISAKYAPFHEDMMSKTLKPENNMALIYLFRPDNGFWAKTRKALPVNVGGEKIGNFWFGQYVYYYAYPHTLILKSQDGGAGQYNIQAGNTYYFIFENAKLGSNPHWRQLAQNEGVDLLKEYKLSGDFKKVIFKYGEPNKPLTPTENNRQVAIKLIETGLGKGSSLNYDNKTRTGTLSYKAAMEGRHQAFTMIESICDTKNIALKTGDSTRAAGAAYITLDEEYKDYSYHIKFECLY